MATRAKGQTASIDCALVTIQIGETEFGFDTASSVSVTPQVEETDAVKLIVKGILRSQKPKESTNTGSEIVLVDNMFTPELVLAAQGGAIVYDETDPTKIIGYNAPVSGSGDSGEIFVLNMYTSNYDLSGQIINYEKISYPNCQGSPITFGGEDGTFRAPEYTIISSPNKGQSPFSIVYVDTLPELT